MALLDALLLDPYPFEVWIAKRTDGLPGSGTLNDPWDGSTTARFDAVMSSLPANTPTTVHLGPGEFTTKGYTDDPNTPAGWEMKPGMRLIGSGVAVTTLKLDTVTPAVPARHFAVGHRLINTNPVAFNPVDFCEVTDLTINCNLEGQGTNVAAGAIRLMGNHVRVQRVKAINWGTSTTAKSCFVVQLITGHTDAVAGRIELQNAVIDGCVATDPDTSQGWGTAKISTVFHVGGLEDVALQAEGYGLAPVIRNCFVDGMTADPEFCPPLEADTRALSMGWCRAGLVEGNHSFLDAFESRPSRLEALLPVARYYRESGQYHLGPLFSRWVNEVPYPNDLLFVERSVYEYELPLEYALCCAGVGLHEEAMRVCDLIVARRELPACAREAASRCRQDSQTALSCNGNDPKGSPPLA